MSAVSALPPEKLLSDCLTEAPPPSCDPLRCRWAPPSTHGLCQRLNPGNSLWLPFTLQHSTAHIYGSGMILLLPPFVVLPRQGGDWLTNVFICIVRLSSTKPLLTQSISPLHPLSIGCGLHWSTAGNTLALKASTHIHPCLGMTYNRVNTLPSYGWQLNMREKGVVFLTMFSTSSSSQWGPTAFK